MASKLLELAKQPMAGPSSSDGKIMEGDIFQTYGGRRINVSICNVLHSYFKNEDTFEQRYLEMIAHKVEVPLLACRLFELF